MSSLWMLVAAFAFSVMGVCVKLASSLYTTSEIVFYRGLVGAIVLYALIRYQGGTLSTTFPRAHLWRCLIGVTSLWMWFFGIAHLPLATAMTLNYLNPVWIAAMVFAGGWFAQRRGVQPDKRFEWPLLGAILLSFVGVALALRPAVQADQMLGAAVGLSSSVITAIAYLQVRKLGRMGEPEYRVVFFFSCMTALAGLAGTFIEPHPDGTRMHAHTWTGALLLVAVGVIALSAQMAMTRAYRVGKVLVVSNLQYTGIVFSSLWGILIWDDRFDWLAWLGMGIILVSGIAATFYNTRSTVVTAKTADPIASEL
jgi:S-adenosylmethionine uptake transporter